VGKHGNVLGLVGLCFLFASAGCGSDEHIKGDMDFRGLNARDKDAVYIGDTKWILSAPDKVEFMTLDSSHENFDPKAAGTMHGYRIMGSAEVADAELKKQLVGAVKKAVQDSDGTVAACFMPQHALRVVRGNSSADLVICFHCLQLEVYQGTVHAGASITREGLGLFEKTAEQLGLSATTRPAG